MSRLSSMPKIWPRARVPDEGPGSRTPGSGDSQSRGHRAAWRGSWRDRPRSAPRGWSGGRAPWPPWPRPAGRDRRRPAPGLPGYAAPWPAPGWSVCCPPAWGCRRPDRSRPARPGPWQDRDPGQQRGQPRAYHESLLREGDGGLEQRSPGQLAVTLVGQRQRPHRAGAPTERPPTTPS